MDLLAFGNTGWGDELFFATLMTIAVSITAMAVIETAIVINVAKNSSSPQPVFPNAKRSILRGDYII